MLFKSENYGCNNGLRVTVTNGNGSGEGTLGDTYDYYSNPFLTDCDTNDPDLLIFTSVEPGVYTISATCDGQLLFPPETIEVWGGNCRAFEFINP